MKYGICSEIFETWPLPDAMSFAARAGYHAFEIAPFTLANYVTEISPSQRQQIRGDAARAGIEISGIHWVLAKAEGMHLTHPDSTVRERTSQYFQDLVDFCADLGGTRVIVGSPKQRSMMEGVTASQALPWAAEVFRPCIELAGKRGVIVCLEPLSPSDTNFINTAAEAIAFVEKFSSPISRSFSM